MDIRVPALAEGIDSGTIVSILVKIGDRVKKDDPLVEIETNKAVADIPSTGEGTVSKIHVQEGDDVPVGSILISLNGEGTEVSTPKEIAEEAKPSPGFPSEQKVTPASATYVYPSKSGFPPPASPSIRKMAHELGVDLARIQGSGHGGRITREDIRIYMKQMQNMDSASKPAAKKFASPIDFSKWGTVEKIKMTKLRKTIARVMTASWTTIPHVTQFDDLPIDSILALISKHKDKYKSKGVRLTLTSFIIRAVGYVLKEFPNFNTSIDEEAGEIVYKKYFHIGIAVDTEHGLMVPILRDVDKKSLFDISRELGELARKTRERKLSIEDMRGGTFTISNQGAIGGKYFTPIINSPEVAILGLGRGYAAPIFKEDKFEKKTVMPTALSYDHRLIDGAQAARFMLALGDALNQFTDKDVSV